MKKMSKILILVFIVFFEYFLSENSTAGTVLTDEDNSAEEIKTTEKSRIAEIKAILEEDYLEPERLKNIDWNSINKMEEEKGILEIFKNLDPHSYYMGHKIFEMRYGENNEPIKNNEKIDLTTSFLFFEEKENLKIGYLKINNFDSFGIAEDLLKKIFDLIKEGADKFILDLRGNLGGFLNETVAVTDIFLKLNNTDLKEQFKPITIIKDKNNKTVLMPYSSNKADFISLLIVLVDEESASGSEIVASALQDYNEAIIIGVPTFGKATAQTIFSFKNGGAAIITTGRFYRPNGETLQGYGVIPDIIIPKKIIEKKIIIKEKDLERTVKPGNEPPFVPFSDIPQKYQDDFQLMKALEIIKSFEKFSRKTN